MTLNSPLLCALSHRRSSKSIVIDGQIQPDFRRVADSLRQQIERFGGGAAVCVYHRGECVVDLWGGHRNGGGTPWLRDTMAPSFSTTKGVASTLIHVIADRGLIDYETTVATYWPEFAQAGKSAITIRQVLAHQSGLYHIRQMIDRADRMLDWDYMVRAIEQAEPIHAPGARTGYHGLTYGFLVGEILQRVTGMSFPDLVERELARPLQLDGLYVGTPEDQLPRAAELMWPERSEMLRRVSNGPATRWLGKTAESLMGTFSKGLQSVGIELDLPSIVQALAPRGISSFDFGSPETLRQPIPAGNGLFTARSLARMYAALAEGGEIDGVRLFSRRTLGLATELQQEAPGRSVLPFDMRWRLGYHGIATSVGFAPHAFGHFGFGGSGAWADPSRRLAVGMIVNCGMGTPFGDMRMARISGAALLSAHERGDPAPHWIQLPLRRRKRTPSAAKRAVPTH
jgi:CubicO group peptidase (beta-lactamase class C family)